jgi:hypothetical protein
MSVTLFRFKGGAYKRAKQGLLPLRQVQLRRQRPWQPLRFLQRLRLRALLRFQTTIFRSN